MPEQSTMILVTGATGGLGRAVLDAVQKSGEGVRAMIRNEKDAGKIPAAVSTVVADFSDTQSLRGALADVDAAFVVCSPIPGLANLESNVVNACVEAAVSHVVLASALGAGDYPKSFPSWHRQVEEKLKSSGLGYTILRPNSFMRNILAYMAPSIRAQDAFYSAMGDARTSYIDARDIAAVAAKVLGSPADHARQIYELNGPEAVSNAELAHRISRVAGRKINFVNIPESAQRKSMLDLGMPLWQVDAVLDLQQYYVQGQGGEVTDVLERLIGRPAINLDAFLAEHQDHFRRFVPAQTNP
jgi:uncharacterized protein YbjT (DUF2867 family)